LLLVCSWCWMVGVAVSWPRGCCTTFRFPLLGWCLFCLPTRLRHRGFPRPLCCCAFGGWMAGPPGCFCFLSFSWPAALRGTSPCVRAVFAKFSGVFWPAPRVGVGGEPLAIVSGFSWTVCSGGSVVFFSSVSFAFRGPCSHLRRHHEQSVCTAPGQGCVYCAALSPLYLPVPLGPV